MNKTLDIEKLIDGITDIETKSFLRDLAVRYDIHNNEALKGFFYLTIMNEDVLKRMSREIDISCASLSEAMDGSVQEGKTELIRMTEQIVKRLSGIKAEMHQTAQESQEHLERLATARLNELESTFQKYADYQVKQIELANKKAERLVIETVKGVFPTVFKNATMAHYESLIWNKKKFLRDWLVVSLSLLTSSAIMWMAYRLYV